METNYIIDELKAIEGSDWNPEQKAFCEQRAAYARVVECVPMRDVFTPEQLRFLFKDVGYNAQKNSVIKMRPIWSILLQTRLAVCFSRNQHGTLRVTYIVMA